MPSSQLGCDFSVIQRGKGRYCPYIMNEKTKAQKGHCLKFKPRSTSLLTNKKQLKYVEAITTKVYFLLVLQISKVPHLFCVIVLRAWLRKQP